MQYLHCSRLGVVRTSTTLWCVLALLGCSPDNIFEGTTDVRPFTPPPAYQEIWDKAAKCAGATGIHASHNRYRSIRWYVTPDVWWSVEHNKEVSAITEYFARTTIIAATRVTHAKVVAHEMTHILIRQSGHPEVFERCHLIDDDGTWGTADTTGIQLH